MKQNTNLKKINLTEQIKSKITITVLKIRSNEENSIRNKRHNKLSSFD
jgi:hypothetical protein